MTGDEIYRLKYLGWSMTKSIKDYVWILEHQE